MGLHQLIQRFARKTRVLSDFHVSIERLVYQFQ